MANVDYVRALNNLLQANGAVTLFNWGALGTTGHGHAPVHTIDAIYNGAVIGSGTGSNKNAAKQAAAAQAYAYLRQIYG
ncbi:hypothetical protein DENSPDRAFT_831552 [Dentipellis sp. KUC8613]|nr:hypothetical protein DENSPDRAFT_831552 [Dentipellis sp. KUC8613]